MAQQIKEYHLAWDALSGHSKDDGWRTIRVSKAGTCILMAGRRFPGNEEALLVGFSSVTIPATEKLPEGHGFEMLSVHLNGDNRTWVALTRKESGNFELFAEMVSDVVGVIDFASTEGEAEVLRAFTRRVRSWQEFMKKGPQALGPEAEIGLIGELIFLGELLVCSNPKIKAIESWVGPLNGIQDFEIGIGAIEVKTTLSSMGFPAKIGSLEQLDDSIRKPIFISGIRLLQSESGYNLPELIASTRDLMREELEAGIVFTNRLLAAGYIDSHAHHYSRRVSLDKLRLIEVDNEFPRIIAGNVPSAIRKVMYEIDLDRVQGRDLDLPTAFNKLGVE